MIFSATAAISCWGKRLAITIWVMENFVNTFIRFRLRMPAAIYEAMLAHARAELPNECCGLLAGQIEESGALADVSQRYPLVNELKSPTEFLSEPYSMFAAVKEMHREGIEI